VTEIDADDEAFGVDERDLRHAATATNPG
jgi:hypothetical protein